MITMSLRVFEKQSPVTRGDCTPALPDTVPSGTGEVQVSQRALAALATLAPGASAGVTCKAARGGG